MWLLGIVQGLNSHPFENTDISKNQLEALLIRTLIGLECVVLQTVAPSHSHTSLLFIIIVILLGYEVLIIMSID